MIDIATDDRAMGKVMAFDPIEQGTATALRARAAHYERVADAARIQLEQLEAEASRLLEEIARRAAEGARVTTDARARLFLEDIAARAVLKSAA